MRLSSKTDFLGEQKYICYSFDIIQFSTRLKYIQKEHVTPYPRKMCTKVLVGVMDPGQLAFYNDAQMVSQFHSVRVANFNRPAGRLFYQFRPAKIGQNEKC